MELIKNLYSNKKKKRHRYSLSAWCSLIMQLWQKFEHKSKFLPSLLSTMWCLPLSCSSSPSPLTTFISPPFYSLCSFSHHSHSLSRLSNLCRRFICNTIPRSAGWVWYRMWSNLTCLILSILFFTRVWNTSIKPPLKVAFVACSAD